jgi:cellulose synthase/poly-beta-1,6-N-acetylglucosamine synthase-like glycosyltransferase
MCRKLGANHFSRKNLSNYQAESGTFKSSAKCGNYNAWLYEIGFDKYDLITIFDPDQVPHPTFLSSALAYFNYPGISYVQFPQAYYNQKASFVARGAAEETYSYYSSLQMASYGMGYPIIVGCHNTHRVTALKQVGGFPAHDGEDLLLTLFYQGSGWKGVYVPQILAKGLTPVDWGGYLNQQRRWARVVLDIKFRLYPRVAKNLSIKTRLISFLHGLNYLHKSLVILTCILLLGFMLATGVTPRVISYLTLGKLAILYKTLTGRHTRKEIPFSYRHSFYGEKIFDMCG